MSRTDQDIDRGLQQLPQLVPEVSVWDELESQLLPQQLPRRKFWQAIRSSTLLPLDGSIAAALLVALLVFMAPALDDLPVQGSSQERVQEVGDHGSPVQVATNRQVEKSSAETGAGSPSRGKFVRHLYAGDEALWDAMLEEEIHLVDLAILQSSPGRQRKLWLYRNNLVKQLTALRHQPAPEKYLF